MRVALDLSGKTFKDWYVDSYIGNGKHKVTCTKCGKSRDIGTYYIIHDKIPSCKSCGNKSDNRLFNYIGTVLGNWTVEKYIYNGEYELKCNNCGDTTVLGSYYIKKGRIPRCKKCIGSKIGKSVDGWNIVGEASNVYKIQCIKCGHIRELSKYRVRIGEYPRCEECMTEESSIYIGKNIKNWTVTNVHWPKATLTCNDCGTEIVDTVGNVRKSSIAKCSTCELMRAKEMACDGWQVLYKENTTPVKWRCRCLLCGECYDVLASNLMAGRTKNCGCTSNKTTDYTGKSINGTKIIKSDLANHIHYCICRCGNKFTATTQQINSKHGPHCGCLGQELSQRTLLEKYGVRYTGQVGTRREQWQLDVVSSKDKLLKFIETNYDCKPSVVKLSIDLGYSRGGIHPLIHKYGIEDKVEYGSTSVSNGEMQVREIFGDDVLYNDRKILNGLEIDIFDAKNMLGIEYNGNYWHSSLFKGRKYHYEKTDMCNKYGIRLMHIFEYEWENSDKRDILKSYINKLIGKCNTKVIGARECEIALNMDDKVAEFYDNNHLQGACNASVNIALVIKGTDNIVAAMSFGAPRFDRTYDCELIRYCTNLNYSVIGGAEKIFNYFTHRYTVGSIISYCDISKFTGKVYERLGFISSGITEPNYVWASYDGKVLSRYQCQKSKLIQNGFGSNEDTEDDIMYSLGYMKIYDCGNKKWAWNRTT